MPSAKAPLLWLRFPNETTTCPGCATTHVAPLDVFPVPRKPDGRRVSFLMGCHDCGLLFANPLPTSEQLERYYSDAGHWAELRAERTHKLEEAYRRGAGKKRRPKPARAPGGPELLLDALAPYVPVHAPPPGAKVLDFGCGDGKLLNRLQDRGWDTFGIEPSTGVAFFRHQRLEAPPQDASFKFAILHHVLEHVNAPLDVLRQLAGAMCEGGVLFISVPRLDTLPEHGDFSYCIDGRRHIVAFSERCLRGLLARAGFASTANIDMPELDAARTNGRPMRLRVVATRTATPPAPPDAPLAPAMEALRQYTRRHQGLGGRVRGVLPVRLRAALMDRHREKSGRRHAGR